MSGGEVMALPGWERDFVRKYRVEELGDPKPVVPRSTIAYTVAGRKRSLRQLYARLKASEDEETLL
jgi:hypothetical protein